MTSKLALFFVDTCPKTACFSENIDDIHGDATNKKDGQIIE
jgi:glutaredoxin-related protein